jgi:hypothetical protein
MSWQKPILLYGAFIAVITYIARRLSVPAWLAVSIPNLPVGLLFGYCVFGNVWGAGQGGALPMWMLNRSSNLSGGLMFGQSSSLLRVLSSVPCQANGVSACANPERRERR